MSVLTGIPVKSFTVAKRRLAPVLDAATRSRLGRAIALRTAGCARAAGADVRVVAGDDAVDRWAVAHGFQVLREPPGGGLDAAAGVVAAATTGEWAILHADLPLLAMSELRRVLAVDGFAIAPAHDGGTSLIKGRGSFPFAYGPASFHRHLAARPDSTVFTSPGLALDLDTPEDLDTARRQPGGDWLETVLRPRHPVAT